MKSRALYQTFLSSAVLLLLSNASGCDEPDPRLDWVQVRDSSGVTIVESHEAAWSEGQGWRVPATPSLSIGDEEQPGHSFGFVAGALRRPDGSIVVADGMNLEIRFFSADGQLKGVFGRSGEGPGEFQRIETMGRLGGDTIWVHDLSLRRLTLFTAPGDEAQVITLVPRHRARVAGRMTDGSWLAWFMYGPEEPSAGFGRNTAQMLRYDSDGVLVDTVAEMSGREFFFYMDGTTLRRSAPWFARNISIAVGGDGFFAGDQETFEIRQMSPKGEVLSLFRLPGKDLSVSDQEIEDAIAFYDRAMSPRFRAVLDDLPRPIRKPAYSHFLHDGMGNLWVARFAYPQGVEALERLWARGWEVFNPDGEWLGTVELPPDVQPVEIGDDWLLGVRVNELGVQTVQLYALLKP